MGRRKIPAPGHEAVRTALDSVRVRLGQIGGWLKTVSPGKKPVSASTLNNYRDGRRSMPAQMRRILAKQLRKHAREVEKAATELERAPLE